MINQNTQLNMIIGYPLAHTQTPILHNTLYKQLQCNAVMLAHPTHNLAASLSAMRTLSVQLLVVTMPYKTAITPLLNTISSEAEKLNAVIP